MSFSQGVRRIVVVPALASLAFIVSPALFGQATTKESKEGAALFKKDCAGCHGANGAGQTAMGRSFKLRDLRSPEVQQTSDAQITEIISKGKGRMPAFGTRLNKDQIQDLVDYIRVLGKSKA